MDKYAAIFNKKDIPATWEEISRSDNGKQLTIRLGHINPGTHADKQMAAGGNKVDADGNSIVIHGISIPVTMTRFFDSMMELAMSGLIPALKPGDISTARTQYNAVRDEKFDIETGVTIADYGSEQAATEALENLNPTRTMTIGGRNMLDILADPKIREHMTEEQLKLIANLPGQLAQAQNDIKTQGGMNYYQDSFLGYPGMFLEMDSPRLQQSVTKKTVSSKKSKGLSGGGFDSMVKARPAVASAPEKLLNCLGVRVGNYLITGSLLNNVFYYPEGTEYCHSLTRHDTKVEKETVDGRTYTTTHWLPVESTLAAEGYLNREEITAMLQNVFNQLNAIK